MKPVLCIIAGSDNSAAAGMEQDLRTAAFCGVKAVTVSTGRTLQSPRQGLEMLCPPSRSRFLSELAFAFRNFNIRAVKIGALTHPCQIRALSLFLKRNCSVPVVLDPVFRPTTGKPFIPDTKIRQYVRNLIPQATVVTPNAIEAEQISAAFRQGIGKKTGERLRQLCLETSTTFIVTGGHGSRDEPLLEKIISGETTSIQKKQRLELDSERGTGCAFSTALACELLTETDLLKAYHSAGRKTAQLLQSLRMG